MDELRILLKLCRFDVFGATETHLTSEIADREINIEDYSLVRRDRPGRQGGGCAVYYRKSLKVTHRPDLEDNKVEGIFMQVKAGSRDTMVGIIYRPPNHNSEFFTVFPNLLENVWLKFSNMVLLGDFNTNLLQNERGATSYEGKKMEGILAQFNLKNVIEGPTRITNYSKTLINLIVTNRKDLVKQKGSYHLGISDHDMIYATLSGSISRDPPKIITIRNFNNSVKDLFKVTFPARPFKFAKYLTIPLMFIIHGTCSLQNCATNTRHSNK